jgi:hypothetical protein
MKSGEMFINYIVILLFFTLPLACSLNVGDNDENSDQEILAIEESEAPEQIFGRYEVFTDIVESNCPQNLIADRNSSFQAEIYEESEKVFISLENITGNPQDVISGEYDPDTGVYEGTMYQASILEESGELDCELVTDAGIDADFSIDGFDGVFIAHFSLTGPECDQADAYELNYLLDIPCETTLELNGHLIVDTSSTYYSPPDER